MGIGGVFRRNAPSSQSKGRVTLNFGEKVRVFIPVVGNLKPDRPVIKPEVNSFRVRVLGPEEVGTEMSWQVV